VTKKNPAAPVIPTPVSVSINPESGMTETRFGSHSEAIAAQTELGGTVERLNLWAVITKGK